MEHFLSGIFRTELIRSVQNWVVTELPGLIIVSILIFITFKIVSFSLRKLKKTLINGNGFNETSRNRTSK